MSESNENVQNGQPYEPPTTDHTEHTEAEPAQDLSFPEGWKATEPRLIDDADPATVDVSEAVALSAERAGLDALPEAGSAEQLRQTQDEVLQSQIADPLVTDLPGLLTPEDLGGVTGVGAPTGVPERVEYSPEAQAAEDEQSNLVMYAKKELHLAGLDAPDSDYNGGLAEAALEIVRVFSRQGHSGGSAYAVIDIVRRLLAYEPLTPLTGEDDEWMNVDGGTLFQNVRDSSVFKGPEPRGAYDIDGGINEYPDGDRTSRAVDITFPYTPDSSNRPVTLVDDDGKDRVL